MTMMMPKRTTTAPANIAAAREEEKMVVVNVTTSDGRSVSVSSNFICPISANVMVNPMMTRTGSNFERAAILAWLEKNSGSCPVTGRPMNVSDILPNHALSSQIQNWQKNNGLLAVASRTKPDGITKVDVPAKFVCPISSKVMVSPLMTRDGRTFERSAIMSWLEKSRGVCPVTGEPLTASELLPNRALEAQIAFWCKNTGIIVIEECHYSGFVGFFRVSSKALQEDDYSPSSLLVGKPIGGGQREALATVATSDIVSTHVASTTQKKENNKKSNKKLLFGRKKFMSRILTAASAELNDL